MCKKEMNDLKAKWVPIDDVIPYENNPRINDEAAKHVANSIKEFGWQQSIVVDENNVIIAGHTRLKAARILGLDTVPITIAHGLSEEQANAYRLADNKVAESSSWENEILQEELSKISSIDMSMFNFNVISEQIDFETVPDVQKKSLGDVRRTFFLVCCKDDGLEVVKSTISRLSGVDGVEIDSTEKWYEI